MKVLDIDGLEYYNSIIENTYATKSYVNTQDALKAPLASPAFTGTPTSTTPSAGDDSTKIATTEFVQAELADYVTLNDLDTELSDYLPLSGGTMTGVVSWENEDEDTFNIGFSDANEDNVDVGWTYADKTGAGIGLRNITHTDGGIFNLWATDGTNIKTLIGKPDGTLTWSGATVGVSDDSIKIATTAYVKDCVPKSVGGTQRPVYTNSNGVVTACTATGSSGGLEGVNSSGTGWIRYESGLQITWQKHDVSSTNVTITFPKAFDSNPTITSATGARMGLRVVTITKTNFIAQSDNSGNYSCNFIAIGTWK